MENPKIDIGVPEAATPQIRPSIYDVGNIEIKSINDVRFLKEQISYYRGTQGYNFLFRGHTDCSYKLLSSIAREDKNIEKEELVLSKLIDILKKEGYEKYKLDAFNDNLFYLGIGRHLGLDCRLLDWTAGFWQAISFLLKGDLEKDGDLWVMAIPRSYRFEKTSPFDITDNRIHIFREAFYIPDNAHMNSKLRIYQPLGLKRQERQNGLFTATTTDLLHTPLNDIRDESGIIFLRYQIVSNVKKQIKNDSHLLDVNKWLYVTKDTSLEKRIKSLNNIYKK